MSEIEKIESLISMEEKHASSLAKSVDGLSNIVVQEILRGIAHDSRKHAGFYSSILSLLKGESQAIAEKDYIRLEEVLKKHIEVEDRMMGEAKQLLSSEKDSRITHLLTEIFEDEIEHHALMKRLLEAVIKREAIFEADVWDQLWMDVKGHGSPGG